MVASGSSDTSPDPSRWQQVLSLEGLGHLLQHDGGIGDCWAKAKASMWRSFWGNAASAGARKLPLKL